ncbi:hypothetical protein FBZ87_104223 [Nitrospirillum amazonense]|uniref:N-acetyltransferase domain-containing protein n=1 Tax=Nitrospirillum amazonense TaxID=28077 RepID=A0A560K020_9PROT|nr:hypothetical protein [Nitrospirillum amazonense]TWB75124.1 hypothetical protein FBZ87_104223 [Nitrospirillum amazonense]
MPTFVTRPLDARQIDQAYALMRPFYPDLTVERWRDHAQALLAPGSRGGIVTVQLDHRYMHGLFSYLLVPDLDHRLGLQVDVFVALDLFDPEGAGDALLAEMDRIARRHGCDAIHITLPDSQVKAHPSLARFRALGHLPEGRRLCKHLQAEPMAAPA